MRGLLWVFTFLGVLQSSSPSAAGPSPGQKSPGGQPLALDRPSFTATPAELIALAAAAPTGEWSTVVLRDQYEVSYDDQGRATVRARRVYVVQGAEDGEDEDGRVLGEWRPSYQDRPVIRARVISPAGNAVELDPATIQDQPASPRPTGTDGDRRYLVAQLPPIVPGSVVEQETVVRDREPALGGRIETMTIGGAPPTSSTVIALSAPASVKLRHVEHNLPPGVRARHDVARGRDTWTWEIPALPARHNENEIDAPADVVLAPSIGVTTAGSWEAVARTVRKQVDQRIADGPVDLPAELPRAATAETAGAIAAWLHQRVHGTGGATHGVRVPRSPADTVKQAGGDCNDKAALLVALLRQVGIRAEVAPVAGRWQSLDPELPGLEAFEHVLVRARIGAGDVWIDPDEELARPGQLPERDQGRRALVIAGETKALTTTPGSTPADNAIREVRTFVAAESGLSQLTQVVRYTGMFELEQRSRVHGVRADQLRRAIAASVKSAFGGTLDQASSTDARDLTRPFETTRVVKDSSVVYTELEQIDVYLSSDAVLDQLPWTVTGSSAPRRSDYVWTRPHVHEIEDRIVVPPGFTLPAPAPERVRQLGTATLTERQRIDGQTLIVSYRLDTGKPRLTPGELTTLRARLKELDGEQLHLKIDLTGSALSFAGKPREAITECERLIALHPTEALHHSQLASVLVRAGAGEAARREARKAVAMAPSDAGALVVLGWVLSFDTLGRRYTYDWDRAGAIAALQQARKLAPRHLGAVLDLAAVLQRGASGRLYEGADLAGAAEAWRAALALERTDPRVLALASVLVWSGAWDEAEKIARTAKESEDRNKWIVTAIAGGSGAAAAVQAASALATGDSRNRLLSQVYLALVFLRRYDVAREIAAETGTLARAPANAVKIFEHVTQQPELPAVSADPRSAVLAAFAMICDPQERPAVFSDAQLERELRSIPGIGGLEAMPTVLGTRWVRDVLQATIKIEIDGDAGLWRASIEHEQSRFRLYVVLDRGVAKLVGGTGMVSSVGRYILGAGAKADARARKLLDWVQADANQTSTLVSFKRIWGPGMPSSHDAIQLAGAVLAGRTDPDRVITVASRCPSTLPDAAIACHEALFFAYRARGRWTEAVEQSEAILAARPGDLAARAQIHAWALARAGRFDDAEHLLDQVLAKDPDHLAARIGRFEVAAMRGATADMLQRADALTSAPSVEPGTLNYVAWYRLGQGGDLTSALELARRAVDKLPRTSEVVNTLAAIEAERGELDRAVHDNWKAMELSNASEPSSADWYVEGRILEQLGLTADAVAAYKRVTPPEIDQLLSTHMLAQRRLAALGSAH